jgi:hypothetical protein
LKKFEKQLNADLVNAKNKKCSKFIQMKNFTILKHKKFVGTVLNSRTCYYEINNNNAFDASNRDELFISFMKNFIE